MKEDAVAGENESERVTTRTSKSWLGADGIIRMVMHEGAEEHLADAVASIDAINQVSGGRGRPVVIDLRGLRSVDRDARRHYQRETGKGVITVVALLVGSPLTRMIANFYLRSGTVPWPTRMFTAEPEAIAWLESQAL